MLAAPNLGWRDEKFRAALALTHGIPAVVGNDARAAARDLVGFTDRLTKHEDRLESTRVEYRRDAGPMPWQMRPGILGNPSTPDECDAYLAAVVANIAQ